MKNNVNLTNEQTQPGSDSPICGFDSSQANEERFNHFQTEMSALKAMMERLIQQNEEKERQTDAFTTTSSFAVWASNRYFRIPQKIHFGFFHSFLCIFVNFRTSRMNKT